MFEKTNAEEEEGQSFWCRYKKTDRRDWVARVLGKREREKRREKGEKLVATPFRAGAVAVGDLSRSTLFPAFESFFFEISNFL